MTTLYVSLLGIARSGEDCSHLVGHFSAAGSIQGRFTFSVRQNRARVFPEFCAHLITQCCRHSISHPWMKEGERTPNVFLGQFIWLLVCLTTCKPYSLLFRLSKQTKRCDRSQTDKFHLQLKHPVKTLERLALRIFMTTGHKHMQRHACQMQVNLYFG